MNNLEVEGKVIQILEEVSGTSRSGNNWVKQGFVIETEGPYPKQIQIDAWQNRIEQLKKINEGDFVRVGIDIQSREYNNRWYTDVKAWRIDKTDGSAPSSSEQAAGGAPPPPPPPPPDNTYSQDSGGGDFRENQDDDLPF